jgi:hypothetical protein
MTPYQTTIPAQLIPATREAMTGVRPLARHARGSPFRDGAIVHKSISKPKRMMIVTDALIAVTCTFEFPPGTAGGPRRTPSLASGQVRACAVAPPLPPEAITPSLRSDKPGCIRPARG